MVDDFDYDKYAEAQARRKKSADDLLKDRADALKKSERELAVMEKIRGIDAERLDVAEKKRQVEEEALKLAEDTILAKRELTKAEAEDFLMKQRVIDSQREGAKSAEDAAKRFLGLTKDGGQMFDNWTDKAAGFGDKMKQLLTVKNLAAAGITKVAQATVALALEQDAAAVAFNKATGQAGTYNEQIQGLERSMVNAGVTSAEASQAFQDLFITVTDFSNMSERTKADLAKTVALLNELGVSSSESAQSIQFLTKVMGKTTRQAAAQSRELFVFAQDLGVSAAGMSADFIKMQPQIAALGDTGVQAFKDLQAQAKATGIEFDSLLSITAKFDTFAGAAEQVGKLNAIMGGPFLNTLEMVATTDPAERMRKLSEGINASGLSFDQMSYYQKKAMTAAAGLNNEMELAMLMSGKLEDARGPVKSQADLEKLANQTREFNTVMDELKQFAMSLAIGFGPVVSVIKAMVDGLTSIAPILKPLIYLATAYAAAMSIAAVASAIASGGWAVAGGAAAIAMIGGAAVAANNAASGQNTRVTQVGDLRTLPGVDPNGGPIVQTSPAEGGLGKVFQGTKNDKIDMSPTAGDSAAPQGPIVINLKIGNETIQQIVHDTDISKTHYNGKKSIINESAAKALASKMA